MSAEYNLNINGEPYNANRKNTTLFTFAGSLAIYDHVFCVLGEEEAADTYRGCYIFKIAQEKLYGTLGKFIVDNNFPQILNRNEVPECDITAWENRMFNDLRHESGVPEPWNDQPNEPRE
jgi:hypothetical protein